MVSSNNRCNTIIKYIKTSLSRSIHLKKKIIFSHDAIFFNHGQNCCAGSRTFVQEGIYDKFVAKAKSTAIDRKVGDPWSENVQQGPLVKY